jgi:NAD(P)-dependent dehydrogenase (short-subunit alcohol dehydrogenase family)
MAADDARPIPADSLPLLLRGKVVVVCGIGPGLGRALAVQSARAGADVVLASRTEGLSKEVAAEITAMGRRAVTVMTDVTDDELAAGLPGARGVRPGRRAGEQRVRDPAAHLARRR